MRRSTMALAAALAAMLAVPAFAQQAPEDRASANAGLGGQQASRIKGDDAKKADSKAAPPVKLDQKALDRGMKEAPAIQQATGAPCQISAAAFRGEGTQKGADGKSQKITIYETACSGALGYLLLAPAGGKPQAFDCLASSASATKCELPANADPKAGLAPLVTAAGKTCAVSDAKYLGTSTTSGQSFYEVACGAAPGFRLASSLGGAPPVANDCAALLDSPNACTMTTKPQVIAALAPVVQASGKACQVSDVRWMGQGQKTGDTFYEFACGSTPGFVAVVDNTGKLKQAVDCAKAQGVGEGCKMTDSTVAASAESGVYTKLATKAGYPCAVSKYRFIGMDKENREVVELACSDHPDGALAIFADAAKPGTKSEILDCVAAGAYGQECKLSDPKLAYPKYSAALSAKGKASCKVSGAAFVGTSSAGVQYVETACADGAPGWVIAYDAATKTAKEVLSCSQATAAGAPCKLPTNVAGNKKS